MCKKDLLKYWGFKDEIITEKENIEYATERETHIWTINKKYILKASKNEKEVINNILIAKLLNKAQIPTQRVIDTLGGQSYVNVDGKYYSLFQKIQGEVLKNYFDGDFVSRSNYIGKALAELHIGLNNITEEVKEKINLLDNDLMGELSGWVKDELNKYINQRSLGDEELKTFKECIIEVENIFPQVYKKLPRQIIHRDFHGENIIFEGDKLIGYIDFDLSQINARLFDICYLLTGSLASIFDKVEMRGEWIKFAKEIIRGYESISKLTKDEVKSIKYMMYSIEMMMIAYFARDGYKEIANYNVRMVNYLSELWNKGVFLDNGIGY